MSGPAERGSGVGGPAMVAVVTSRDGEPAIGGAEAIAECGGRALVIEIDGLEPAALAARIEPLVAAAEVVVIPGSRDGRDLAPRLAARMRRPLVAGAMLVGSGQATVIRAGARLIRRLEIDGPYVATLEPGTRGVPGDVVIPAPIDTGPPPAPVPPDPVVTRVTTPDAAELDLAEATRILAVGAGLGEEGFVRLAAAVADRLGMSLGATRVVTDRGWLPSERQIGTTGAMVAPAVYVALAISGAVQHTNGLGEPEHVVSVNTDGSCPMAAMADVNLVADARGVLIGLAERLGVTVDAELRSAIDGR